MEWTSVSSSSSQTGRDQDVAAVLVTARMKSTRLPNKLTLSVAGKAVIDHLIERLRRASLPREIVLCTSTHPEDDVLVEVAKRNGIPAFRGHEDDVLVRLRDACQRFSIDSFAVTWGDEPLCDPWYVDRVLEAIARRRLGFVDIKGLPTGTFCYGVSYPALQRVCRSKQTEETEVWTHYFRSDPEIPKATIEAEPAHRRQDLRLTLDYPEDLKLLREVFRNLGPNGEVFDLDDVIAFLDAHPEIKMLNAHREADYQKRIERQTHGVGETRPRTKGHG